MISIFASFRVRRKESEQGSHSEKHCSAYGKTYKNILRCVNAEIVARKCCKSETYKAQHRYPAQLLPCTYSKSAVDRSSCRGVTAGKRITGGCSYSVACGKYTAVAYPRTINTERKLYNSIDGNASMIRGDSVKPAALIYAPVNKCRNYDKISYGKQRDSFYRFTDRCDNMDVPDV